MSRMKSFCENGIIGLYVIVWKKHCDSCCCTETWYCLKLIYTFNNKNNKAAFTALFGSKLLSNRSVRHSADVGACDLWSRHVITGKCVVSYKLCVDISSSVVPSSEERERIITVHRPRAAHQQGGGRGLHRSCCDELFKIHYLLPQSFSGELSAVHILFPAFLLMWRL